MNYSRGSKSQTHFDLDLFHFVKLSNCDIQSYMNYSVLNEMRQNE